MANFQNRETTILICFKLTWLRKKLTVKKVDLDGTLYSIEAEYVAHIKANIYNLENKPPYKKRMLQNHILNGLAYDL